MTSVSRLGFSYSRRLHNPLEHEVQEVLRQGRSRLEFSGRRLTLRLESPLHVCLPPSAADPASGRGTPQTSSQSNPGDIVVAKTILVPNHSQAVESLLPPFPGGVRPIAVANNERRPPSSPRRCIPRSNGLEHLALTFSEWVRETLLNSRKPSTRRSYQSKWFAFVKWLPPSYRTPEEAALPMVFDFLLLLVDGGLSHSSIRVYLSALSAFHTPVEGYSLFSHPLSKHFLNGLLLTHPPSKPIRDSWDLPLVLHCLT